MMSNSLQMLENAGMLMDAMGEMERLNEGLETGCVEVIISG